MGMSFAEQVLRAIARAGVTTATGVSVGRKSDKATWRVDYLPSATQADRDATAAAIAAFDPADPTVVNDTQTAEATALSANKDISATIAWAIRLKDTAAWNAATTAQKKSQVQAARNDWRDIRVFIENNF